MILQVKPVKHRPDRTWLSRQREQQRKRDARAKQSVRDRQSAIPPTEQHQEAVRLAGLSSKQGRRKRRNASYQQRIVKREVLHQLAQQRCLLQKALKAAKRRSRKRLRATKPRHTCPQVCARTATNQHRRAPRRRTWRKPRVPIPTSQAPANPTTDSLAEAASARSVVSRVWALAATGRLAVTAFLATVLQLWHRGWRGRTTAAATIHAGQQQEQQQPTQHTHLTGLDAGQVAIDVTAETLSAHHIQQQQQPPNQQQAASCMLLLLAVTTLCVVVAASLLPGSAALHTVDAHAPAHVRLTLKGLYSYDGVFLPFGIACAKDGIGEGCTAQWWAAFSVLFVAAMLCLPSCNVCMMQWRRTRYQGHRGLRWRCCILSVGAMCISMICVVVSAVVVSCMDFSMAMAGPFAYAATYALMLPCSNRALSGITTVHGLHVAVQAVWIGVTCIGLLLVCLFFYRVCVHSDRVVSLLVGPQVNRVGRLCTFIVHISVSYIRL